MDFSGNGHSPGLISTGHHQLDGTFTDWQSRIKSVSRPEHPDAVRDREDFLATITLRLNKLPLREIMQAAGVTNAAASDYRRGERVPHPSYWAALSEPVGVGEPSYGLGFNDAAI